MFHRSRRGEVCIDVFGLNLRDQLVADRRRACREVLSLWVQLAHDDDATATIEELRSIRDGERTFTMAQRTVLAQLEARLAKVDAGQEGS